VPEPGRIPAGRMPEEGYIRPMAPNSGLMPGTASPDITPALGLLLSEYGSNRQGGTVHQGPECRVLKLACGDETIEDSRSLTFRLGDAALASSPAEMFCEIGFEVRQAARGPSCWWPSAG
jgi:hypothetical protein